MTFLSAVERTRRGHPAVLPLLQLACRVERAVIGQVQQEAVMRRAMCLVPVLMLALLPVSADAQGKSGKAKSGGGPAFCRSGAGHPVFGWEWCRERGWGNSRAARNERVIQRDRGDAYPDR